MLIPMVQYTWTHIRAAHRKTPLDHLAINDRSPPEAKIALFRSLFRGREDVYPRRFESRTSGRSGYSPACGNEWLRGVCEKPRVKCAACQHQQFLPVTDEVIRWHLRGEMIAERISSWAYTRCSWMKRASSSRWISTNAPGRKTRMPCLPPADESACRPRWNDRDRAMVDTSGCSSKALFLPRWHADLGAHILTETMEHRPEIGLESYDRFFPNQDTLPQGGFGNLIALPLQK